jgi:hypothetical protein
MTIEPDTKDWTWVIQQTCGECSFDASAFPVEHVGALIRANAAAWPAVLERDDVAERPDDSTWSALEYACHVRDVYRVYDVRLERMLIEDDPLFPNWDQDAAAVDDHYNEQDPQQVASELMSAAGALADRFDQVQSDEWDRPGRRSDGAQFTVQTFARYFIHDPVHHLHDVGAS